MTARIGDGTMTVATRYRGWRLVEEVDVREVRGLKFAAAPGDIATEQTVFAGL